jgi:hypothetical protein
MFVCSPFPCNRLRSAAIIACASTDFYQCAEKPYEQSFQAVPRGACEVHDITTNKPLNMQSWQDVRDVVDDALEEARCADRSRRTKIDKSWGESAKGSVDRLASHRFSVAQYCSAVAH